MRLYRTRGFANSGANSFSFIAALNIALFAQVFVSAGWAQAQDACKEQQSYIPVSREQLLKRAVHRVPPNDPLINNGVVDATVVVEVFVDAAGKVVCTSVVGTAHPLLSSISRKAAENWRFKPIKRSGRAVPMRGEIVFHIVR